jgi:hypothetical protein
MKNITTQYIYRGNDQAADFMAWKKERYIREREREREREQYRI